ncbi:MAG: CapA family protein [Pseudomonadota bacterium]
MGRTPRLLGPLLLAVACEGPWEPGPGQGPLSGVVVDLEGHPIAGAAVSSWEGGAWEPQATTDSDGSFDTPPLDGNRWLRAEASGYLPRARAAAPDAPGIWRLSEDDGLTARLLFAGSTMFARGYYEPQGASEIPPLRPGHELSDIAGVLEGIAPLLEGADLAAMDLETPLSGADTFVVGKENAYATSPYAAPALALAGFHAAGLGTDHGWDLGATGVADTRAALQIAGLAGHGAGAGEEEAWRPTFVDLGALRVALLSCTTVDGDQATESYVADDGLGKGGAALCTEEAVGAAVDAADAVADLVVLQLHAGHQLDPAPSATERAMAEAAVAHGAGLIVGSHPLVNGGLERIGDALAAWSLGPLASDLGLWQTFPSALLEVHVGSNGALRRAFLEPLLLEELRPRGALGWPRQRIARDILSWSEVSAALDDGAVEWDLHGLAQAEERSLEVTAAGDGWSQPVDLRDGWLADVEGAEAWRVGRDLLRIGDFEDLDVDDRLAEGSLWDLDSGWERVLPEAAYEGSFGLRLERSSSHEQALWSGPSHRLPVSPGGALTVAGRMRGDGEAQVRISWYAGTSGESFTHQVIPLASAEAWAPFALELRVPEGAQAVNTTFELLPPERGRVSLDLDSLRIIAWEDEAPAAPEGCDAIAVQGSATIALQRTIMPLSAP